MLMPPAIVEPVSMMEPLIVLLVTVMPPGVIAPTLMMPPENVVLVTEIEPTVPTLVNGKGPV